MRLWGWYLGKGKRSEAKLSASVGALKHEENMKIILHHRGVQGAEK